MPDEDSTQRGSHSPPAALPDGSMPLYASHPLPGMPGGDPVLPQLNWGPEFGATRDRFLEHGQAPRPHRSGLAVALLVPCVLAAALVIIALAR